MPLLKKNDYIKILEYYRLPVAKNITLKQVKTKAEKILAKKLCKCIKKVQTKRRFSSEAKAIGICTDTIFVRKGLKRNNFTCKKGAKLLNKTRKNYSLEKYRLPKI